MGYKSDGVCTRGDENMTKSDRGETREEEDVTNEEEGKNEETKKEDDGLPIDRGWAWMILAGCFLNATLIVGYNRSLALFFVEYLEMFDASAATTTLILGVRSLSYSLFSLVTMHVLVEFFGTRKTVLLGGTIFATSVLCASFAQNIIVLICVHVSLGIGHSMIHSPGLVLISKYFKKRRSLATTMASSAISFSSGVAPVMAEFLLNEYRIRGAMLIISGLTMNIWVGASLYRPLDSFKSHTKYLIGGKGENEPMLNDQHCPDIKDKIMMNSGHKHSYDLKSLKPGAHQRLNSNVDIVSNLSRSAEALNRKHLSTENDEEFRRRTFSEGSKYRNHHRIFTSENLAYASNPDFLAVSIAKIPQFVDASCQDTEKVDGTQTGSPVLRNLRKILRAFDFSLFKNPMFLLLAVCSHLAVILRLAQIYLPARLNELGFSQSSAAILLLITGILDFFCRIFYGFLADLKFLRVHQIMAIGLFITGLATHFMAFYTTYPLLITYAVLNGIFGSAYQCLLPVLVVEFMGIENMAKTLGFAALFQGFATGVTHPILGGIRDLSGSYVACYHYLGTSSCIAAVLLMCEPLVRRYATKTEPKEENTNEF